MRSSYRFILICFLVASFSAALQAQDGGNALRLDNQSYALGGQFVYFPYRDFVLSNKVTVAVWVKWNSDPSTTITSPHDGVVSRYANIVTLASHKADSIDFGQFWLAHNHNNTGFLWGIKPAGARVTIDGSTIPAAGEWHYVVGVYDGSATNAMKLYVDGALEASSSPLWITGNIQLASPSFRLNVGRVPSDYRFLNGDVEGLRIWKRALTVQEIRAQMFSVATVNADSLAGYWNMDGGSGTTIVDQSSSGFNGTFYRALVDIHTSPSTYESIPFTDYTTGSPWKVADGDKNWNTSGSGIWAGCAVRGVGGAGIDEINSVVSSTKSTLTLQYGWGSASPNNRTTPVVDHQNNQTWMGVEDASFYGQRVTSTAPVMNNRAFIETTTPASTGLSGTQISATITSTPSASDNMVIYEYGNPASAPVITGSFPAGIIGRSDLVWGVRIWGTVSSTLVLDYSGFSGVNSPSSVTLLERMPGTDNWRSVLGLSNNTSTRQLTLTGVSISKEYALASTALNPLPVELVSFSALRRDRAIHLKWVTASELQCREFELRRSIAGKSEAAVLAVIPGSGSTSLSTEYRFTDENAPAADCSYQLWQIDRDGSRTLAATCTVPRGALQELQLEVFPNPLHSSGTLRFTLAQPQQVSATVVDALGRTVLTVFENTAFEPGQHLLPLRTDALLSGLYAIVLRTGSTTQTTRIRILR